MSETEKHVEMMRLIKNNLIKIRALQDFSTDNHNEYEYISGALVLLQNYFDKYDNILDSIMTGDISEQEMMDYLIDLRDLFECILWTINGSKYLTEMMSLRIMQT